MQPFHVAIPVDDVQKARAFYRDVLRCEEGRSAEKWVDFNMYGHQFVIHYKPKPEGLVTPPTFGTFGKSKPSQPHSLSLT